jgi:hypothetical protein
MKIISAISGVAAIAFAFTAGPAFSAEQFSSLDGVSVEKMTVGEMDATVGAEGTVGNLIDLKRPKLLILHELPVRVYFILLPQREITLP